MGESAVIAPAGRCGRSRSLTALWIGLATFTALPFRAHAGALTVHMLDVGYGACLVLQGGDSRQPWTGMVDFGTAEALPAIQSELRRLDIRRIDVAFLTHAHPDHAGSLRVWQRPAIQTLYWSGDAAGQAGIEQTLERLRQRGVDVRTARKDVRLSGPGGIEVHVLNPATIDGSIHENEVVLLVTLGKTAVLISGDLDPGVQKVLMRNVQEQARAEGRKLCFATWPHHGDRLDPAWEQGLQDVAWVGVSVGPNPYGLPRIDDYPDLSSRILRTDRLGTFSILMDGEGCRYEDTVREP